MRKVEEPITAKRNAGRSRRKADEARLFSRPHPNPSGCRKDLFKAATAVAFKDISVFPAREHSAPRRAHFSYGAAADECSILGIIAAAFAALKYPETDCRRRAGSILDLKAERCVTNDRTERRVPPRSS
jgi:hypothetical protein